MANATSDIFERLESGDKQVVEGVKQYLREQFGKGKNITITNFALMYLL